MTFGTIATISILMSLGSSIILATERMPAQRRVAWLILLFGVPFAGPLVYFLTLPATAARARKPSIPPLEFEDPEAPRDTRGELLAPVARRIDTPS